jgi:hypothetical protein
MKLPFRIPAGSLARDPSRVLHWLQALAPGLAAAAGVAAVARLTTQWLPFGLSGPFHK